MTIIQAIEQLKGSYITAYAESGHAVPARLGLRQVVLNTIINELNHREQNLFEADASLAVAIERANVAEATADLLMEWCVLNGVDHRTCLGLADDHDSRLRSLQVFRAARAELMQLALRNDIAGQLFTPSAERTRLASYLLLKHSITPGAFERHEPTIAAIAERSVA